MRNVRGFTLIELMIVIAIIAIIAAIAIPGLLQSQRASNERSASATLKTLSSAEVDFYSNDRDGNGVKDFWTRDVSGFYTLCPLSSTDPLKLIELSVAAADSNPQSTGAAPAAATHVASTFFGVRAPKAGFWYITMLTDQAGGAYAMSTNGAPPFDQPWFNLTRYAFLAFPDGYSSGRQLFIINEDHTVLKRGLAGSVRPSGSAPPGSALVQTGAAGSTPILAWPTDTQLRDDYSKLD